MILTNSPAEIARQLLIDLGLGTAAGDWPVYATNEPDTPDNVITTYDTTGVDHGRSMVNGELYTHYGIQVRVRSKEHPAGWLKAYTIRVNIAESVYQRGVAIDANRYTVHCLARIGNVLALGKEVSTSKRNLFTVNAIMAVKNVA